MKNSRLSFHKALYLNLVKKCTLIITGLALLALVPSTQVMSRQLDRREKSQIKSLHLLTANEGWVSTAKQVFWTSSMGKQWKDITPPSIEKGSIIDVFFIDP